MRRIALAIMLLNLPVSAQVIQVGGSNDALLLAVASAPNGAVLVVAPGTYYPFSATGNLTIVAPQRATIQHASGSPGPLITTVVGLSASLPMRLVGLDFVAAVAPATGAAGRLLCTNVHLEDCTAIEVTAQGGSMVMADCAIDAESSPALTAWEAELTLVDSTLAGGVTYEPTFGNYSPHPAIVIRDCVLRAERIQAEGGAPPTWPDAALLLTTTPSLPAPSKATIVDSVLVGAASASAISCWQSGSGHVVTLSNTPTTGSTGCATNAPLASLRWLTRQWLPGGVSTLRSHHLPSTITAIVISFDAVPFQSPLIEGLSFVGGTPNWWIHDFGVSDAGGEFDWTVALPPAPSLQYATAWMHALSPSGLPWHVSAPIGGLVR